MAHASMPLREADVAGGAFRAETVESLRQFGARPEPLGWLPRTPPAGAEAYFQRILPATFSVVGKVSRQTALSDVTATLEKAVPAQAKSLPFFHQWVGDMALICGLFCDTLGSDAVAFRLDTRRGCSRFHQDQVTMRLVTTYAGAGTEWVPCGAADMTAYNSGASNDRIVPDPAATQHMNPWDIAIFKGAPEGLLHRTPDAATAGTSILMRLDGPDFWDRVLKDLASARHDANR